MGIKNNVVEMFPVEKSADKISDIEYLHTGYSIASAQEFNDELEAKSFYKYKGNSYNKTNRMNIRRSNDVAIIPKEGDRMDDVTKTLVNRLDQDLRDHKQEIRDRDTKILTDAQEREQRYRQEMREFKDDAKEREERMLAAIAEMKADLKESFKEVKDESRTTRNTVIGLTVSIILGIAAMVITVVLTK